MHSYSPKVVVSTLILLSAVTISLFSLNPRASALLLVASWKTIPGGIGIPGLTKTYEAELTNRGILPVRVTVGDYVTDSFGQGKNVAHSVERWDETSGGWGFFWGIPRQDFCQPYPTGITPESKVRTIWLWPRQSISTDFVAIQASEGLHLNDSLRFSITPFVDHFNIAVITPPFRIDELPTEADPGFRIRH